MPKWISYGSAQRHENHMYQHFYLLLFEGFIILTYWHPLLLLEKLLDDPNHLQKIIYFHVTAICKTLDVFFFLCAPLFTINNPFWVNMTNCGASVGICLCYPYDECSCNYYGRSIYSRGAEEARRYHVSSWYGGEGYWTRKRNSLPLHSTVHKSTGEVVKRPLETGRPRVLTSLEVVLRTAWRMWSW